MCAQKIAEVTVQGWIIRWY